MSSAGASFSQVPVRGKYYIANYTSDGSQLAEEDLLSWAADYNVEMVGSTLKFDTVAQFENAWSPSFNVNTGIDYGTVVKDMGKSYYINVAGLVNLEYRLVQRVASPYSPDGYPADTEGVSANYNNASGLSNAGKFLICVFSANPENGYDYVQFSRTG